MTAPKQPSYTDEQKREAIARLMQSGTACQRLGRAIHDAWKEHLADESRARKDIARLARLKEATQAREIEERAVERALAQRGQGSKQVG